MRALKLTFYLTCIVALSSCDDQTLRDVEVLNGKISGKEWVMKMGSAIYDYRTQEVKLTLMGEAEQGSSPCSRPFPSTPHVTVTIDAANGTYPLPFSSTQKTLKFHVGNSPTTLNAGGGSVQVIRSDEFAIEGIIIATLDEDNDISGRFSANPCN